MKVTSALVSCGGYNIKVDQLAKQASFDSDHDPGISNIVRELERLHYYPHNVQINKV